MSMDLMIKKIIEMNSPVVAGLDPKLDYVPAYIQTECFAEYGETAEGGAQALLRFNKALIDELCEVVPAVKVQAAYYEMYGIEGMKTLYETVDYAKSKGMYVILDGKRNDIGSTAQAYSCGWLGKTQIGAKSEAMSGADCLTVNPYLGSDGILPFVEDCKTYDKGIFALVKTSNPSSGELQDLVIDGKPLYEKVAELVSGWGADNVGEYGYSAVGAVARQRRLRQQRSGARGLCRTRTSSCRATARRARARTMLRSALIKRGSARLSTRRGPLCARTKRQAMRNTLQKPQRMKRWI